MKTLKQFYLEEDDNDEKFEAVEALNMVRQAQVLGFDENQGSHIIKSHKIFFEFILFFLFLPILLRLFFEQDDNVD